MENVPQETFKRWVKEFRTIDKEIKEAQPTLAAMRKRKKALDESILQWMIAHGVARVQLREDEWLERNVKTSVKPINADVLGDVLGEYFEGDTEQVASLVNLIYDGRPEIEKEILKVAAPNNGKKRSRVRPVEGEEV